MLKQRVLTAIVLVALLLTVLFALPPEVTRLVLAIAAVVSAWEWGGFIGYRRWTPRVLYTLVVVGAGLGLIWLDAVALTTTAVLAVAMVWWVAAFFWVLAFPTRIPKPLIAACGLLVILPFWFTLDHVAARGGPGPWLLLWLLLTIWAADVFAYFGGRRFGRRKLASQVSPGKTWEGVAAGLAGAVAVGVGGAVAGGVPPLAGAALGAAAGAVSVVGDLTVSMFKRHAGVKDSGHVFPGHGGMLDRIDSLAAASPLFVLCLRPMGLVD